MSNIIDSIQLSGVTYQIQGSGGGKAIEAGRGISITTGTTADTVSFNLPISAGTGTASIVEGGINNRANVPYSHAEGYNTQANGQSSHAEGQGTKANGSSSHAEGNGAIASGYYSHAEGKGTTASGNYGSHAEGYNTNASGYSSHAEGFETLASGDYSHAEGQDTIANNNTEHASGQYNVSNNASATFGDSGNTLFSVGNGTGNNARHNAFEIRQNGDIYLSSGGTDIKLQDHLGGGGSVTVDTELDSGSTNPVQNQALYSELRIDNGETETTLAFENRYSTNYPNGCTKLNVEVVGSNNNSDIFFYNDNQRLGYISIDNWGGISVNVHFDGASYEISGTTVTITYPTVTSVTKIEVDNNGNYVFKAIVALATPLKDQVLVNTNKIDEVEQVTARALNELNDNFGGLKLVKLTEAEYNALATKDSSTLYVIVD